MTAASFGAGGAAVAPAPRRPIDAIVDKTPIDPQDIPDLPDHLKKKRHLAWEFIQAAKLSGDPDKRRNAMKFYEDVKRTCERWRCNESFIYFAKSMEPAVLPGGLYISQHHRVMGRLFQRMRDGKTRRGMVFMPPGCGKSLFCSILFPAWLLGQRPSGKVLLASHTKDLVEDFGRSIKDLIQDPVYVRIYPNVQLRADVKAAGRWNTTQGGRFQGVGVGSAAAGLRNDLAGIIDDPISEQDAYSDAARKRVNKWYPMGFHTRALGDAPILIVQTRWHHADLAGTLQEVMRKDKKAEQWEVIKFKAILDEEGAKLLGGGREGRSIRVPRVVAGREIPVPSGHDARLCLVCSLRSGAIPGRGQYHPRQVVAGMGVVSPRSGLCAYHFGLGHGDGGEGAQRLFRLHRLGRVP